MSLNILCPICSEYFKDVDIVYNTRCGHVFHKYCLFEWLRNSTTCPQCRKHCLRHYCRQLYFNFVERTDDDGDMAEIVFPKTYEWVCIDDGTELSEDMSFAFPFGVDEEGNSIYAARGRYNDDLIPAYYVPTKRAVIAPWGFESHHLNEDIELLDISNDDAEYTWVAASNGSTPDNAFETGKTANDNILYTARAEHEGMVLYGKMDQRYSQAYMPYKGKEVSNTEYEILVRVAKKLATKETSHEDD